MDTNLDTEWVDRNLSNMRWIEDMLDQIRDCAIRISDTKDLCKDKRPFETVSELGFVYRGVTVEVHVSIAWMPHHEHFEVSLLTPCDYEVIPIELPQFLDPALDTLIWMSGNVADRRK